MSAFADTSALYALMVRTDDSHHRVRDAFARLVSSGRPLWTTSFVIVETMALLQHRLGLDAAHDFDADLLPALRVGWVDEELYRLGTTRLWQMNRRDLSLVDCVSFEFMKRHGLHVAFAVDPDFQEAGFDVVPKLR